MTVKEYGQVFGVCLFFGIAGVCALAMFLEFLDGMAYDMFWQIISIGAFYMAVMPSNDCWIRPILDKITVFWIATCLFFMCVAFFSGTTFAQVCAKVYNDGSDEWAQCVDGLGKDARDVL